MTDYDDDDDDGDDDDDDDDDDACDVYIKRLNITYSCTCAVLTADSALYDIQNVSPNTVLGESSDHIVVLAS